MFVNRTPRFEPLSVDALDTIDRGWKRLVSEVVVVNGVSSGIFGHIGLPFRLIETKAPDRPRKGPARAMGQSLAGAGRSTGGWCQHYL